MEQAVKQEIVRVSPLGSDATTYLLPVTVSVKIKGSRIDLKEHNGEGEDLGYVNTEVDCYLNHAENCNVLVTVKRLRLVVFQNGEQEGVPVVSEKMELLVTLYPTLVAEGEQVVDFGKEVVIVSPLVFIITVHVLLHRSFTELTDLAKPLHSKEQRVTHVKQVVTIKAEQHEVFSLRYSSVSI